MGFSWKLFLFHLETPFRWNTMILGLNETSQKSPASKMAHPKSPYPSKQKSIFLTSHYTDRCLSVSKNTGLLCFIYVPLSTSLVPTLSLTCPTEEELNFPSIPFLHSQQYELHQNQTPSKSSLVPKKTPKKIPKKTNKNK